SPPSTLFPYTTLFRSHRCGPASSRWSGIACPAFAKEVHGEKARSVRLSGQHLPFADGRGYVPGQSPGGGPRTRYRDRLGGYRVRSEEHTSELQSRENL